MNTFLRLDDALKTLDIFDVGGPRQVLAILLLVLLAAGCSPEPTRRVTRPSARAASGTPAKQSADEFANGREMLFNLYNFDSKEGSLRCSLFFNQWLQTQSADGWKPDPLFDKLPERWKTSPILRGLNSTKLVVDDVEYMESMVWMRDIARWVGEGPLDAPLEQWIDQQQLDSDTERLKLAVKLFDWTVRNIQLMPPPSDGPNQPAKGAARMVRNAMLVGLGDSLERARVFIGLCRQAEIAAVAIASDDRKDETGDQPVPHCVAVLLAGEMFLFDTQLGLPIPAANDEGIATLTKVRANPKWLESLSLGPTLPYPYQVDRFKKVLALVDATPEALSLRMQLIQKRLTGEHRLTLTVNASDIAAKLKSLGIETELWTVPFEAVRYEILVQRLIRQNPQAEANYERGQALFVGTAPLIMGRKLHLHGQFTKSEDATGAKQRYMLMRHPDQYLDDLLTSRDLQKMFSLEKSTYEREDTWRLRLLGFQSHMREAKMHASYWIGLIHFEEANYDSAARWFGVRVMEENPTSLWFPSARYNLARTYERLGEFQKARQLYLEDDGMQKHGSLLRARRLADKVK